MRCPDCNALMNRHAEKPVKGIVPEESAHDEDLEGVVVAIFSCPVCGKVEVSPGRNNPGSATSTDAETKQ